MPSDHDNNLLREGVLNLRTGDINMARHYLERALDVADDIETRTQANFWMSQICSDPLEKRKYLENALANDPGHAEARKALAILDGKIKAIDIVNPDALPDQVAGMQNAKADRFTCPKCGGRMVFDGDGRTLICEQCARNQKLNSAAPQFEQDFILSIATGKGHRTPVATKMFNCQGCGAQFIFSAQQISAVCIYCGSAHVVVLTKELVEPDSIVPLAFSQPQAAAILYKWMEKHDIHFDGAPPEPEGLYLPVWTFDLLGQVPWNGTIYRNKKTEHISGEQSVAYNDIIISGVRKLGEQFAKILPGFETSNAPAYDPRYLSGWPAVVYELAMSDASLEARKQAAERVRSRINAEKGYVSDLNYSTASVNILSFKLVLVPLWHCAYNFQGHKFRVFINGQNGTIHGEMQKQGFLGWLDDIFGE